MKKTILSLVLFALTLVSAPAWAQFGWDPMQHAYQGWGCSCYGPNINLEECQNAVPQFGGGVLVQVRPSFPNGCGAEGRAQFPSKFYGVNIKACCDLHDQLYGTCGYPKDAADTQIGSCGFQKCEAVNWNPIRYRGCKRAVQAYQVAVTIAGMQAYRDAQETLCACSPCGAKLVNLCFYPGGSPISNPFTGEPFPVINPLPPLQ
jgi:hypothetical protein